MLPLPPPILLPAPLYEALRPLPFACRGAFTMTESLRTTLPGEEDATDAFRGIVTAGPKGVWSRRGIVQEDGSLGTATYFRGRAGGRALGYWTDPQGYNEDSGTFESPDTIGADFEWLFGDPHLYRTQAGDGVGWDAILAGFKTETKREGDALAIVGTRPGGYSLDVRLSGDGRRLVSAVLTLAVPGMTDRRGVRVRAWTELAAGDGRRTLPTEGEFFNLLRLNSEASQTRTFAFRIADLAPAPDAPALPIPEGLKLLDSFAEGKPVYVVHRKGAFVPTTEGVLRRPPGDGKDGGGGYVSFR